MVTYARYQLLERGGMGVPPSPSPSRPDVPLRPKQKVRLLLVVSDPIVRKCLQLAFDREDYAVTVAESPNSAIGMLRFIKPDVVLVDSQVWGQSGLRVCRDLRVAPGAHASSFVLLAPSDDPHFQHESHIAGASATLPKPIQAAKARAFIHQIAGKGYTY